MTADVQAQSSTGWNKMAVRSLLVIVVAPVLVFIFGVFGVASIAVQATAGTNHLTDQAVSLGLGLRTFLIGAAILAVALGHVAVSWRPKALSGRWMGFAGLILGYGILAMYVVGFILLLTDGSSASPYTR